MILTISSRLALAAVLSAGLSLPAASERRVLDEAFISQIGAFPDAVGKRWTAFPAPGSKNRLVAEGSKYNNTFNCIPESCRTAGSRGAVSKRVTKRRAGTRTETPSPGALAGKQKKLGAALLVPAVQGIVRAPPKKPASPNASRDD